MKKSSLHRSIALSLICFSLAGTACAPKPLVPDSPENSTAQLDDSADITNALQNLSSSPQKKADILTGISAKEKIFVLTFDSFASRNSMEKVLFLLEKYHTKATFFVSGSDALEDPVMVQKIADAGHTVEADSLFGEAHIEQKDLTTLTTEFAKSSAILKHVTNTAPSLLKVRATTYSDTVRTASAAAGYSHVVQNNVLINYQSFPSYELAKQYLDKLKPGSILSIRLSGTLLDDEYSKKQTKPEQSGDNATKKRPPAPISSRSETIALQEKRLLNTIEWTLRAIDENGGRIIPIKTLPNQEIQLTPPANITPPIQVLPIPQTDDYSPLYLQYRQQNKGKLAEEIETVYTTDTAAAVTFYGIQNTASLVSTLNEMRELQIKGTFFVTAKDVQDHPDSIKRIIKDGHELGAAILPKDGLDYLSVCKQIDTVQRLLENDYGVQITLAKQAYSSIPDSAKEAVSAMNMKLIGHSDSLPRSADANIDDVNTIIDSHFKKYSYTVKRGLILYMRLDVFQKSNTLTAEILRSICTKLLFNTAYTADTQSAAQSSYSIKKVSELLSNTNYTYPVPKAQMLDAVKDQIYYSHLDSIPPDQQFAYMQARYIGTPSTSTVHQLPGFTQDEVNVLDQSGILNTGDSNTIFLTFDDWGTDRSINRLLTVLDKHHVKATFFVRTNYVGANPNLLRAIGDHGHEIASHTDAHLTLSNYAGQESQYAELTPAQIETLRADVVRSYTTLADIVGDMTNEKGKPILTTILRPPTLAIGKNGMRVVFDAGFSTIVSGDFSTGDYQAKSADALYNMLINGISAAWMDEPRRLQKGSIVVMHMSDEAQFTAEALDRFLIWNAAQPQDKRFEFARISDYLT